MKHKHIFTYISLAIVIATSTVIYSCHKERTGIDKTENQNEQSFKDAQLEKRIIAFRDKIDLIRENPTLKTGTGPMEIDSAVWFIESTSNLTYGDATSELDEYVIDSAFIEVPLTNGQILWVDVQVAYDKVVDSLSAHNAAITANEKQLIAADISLMETTDNTVTFKLTSCFGVGSLIGIYNGFGVDDHWKWGASWMNDGGYCDGPYVGTELDSDAAEEIEFKINGRKAVPGGNYFYYTDISVLSFDACFPDDGISLNGVWCNDCSFINPNDNIPNDNMYDYLIFRSYSGYPNHHDCLCPDEMNFYLDGMEEVIYTYAYQWYPSELEDKVFISINIVGDAIFPMGSTTYFHQGTIEYGICHVSNLPPDEL